MRSAASRSAAISEVLAEPVAAAEQPKRREALSRIFAAFMEEKNIRWGELVGGLLIVGCSIALVISFWAQIASQPLVKFARRTLREKFIAADLGVSGANIGIASTGTIVIDPLGTITGAANVIDSTSGTALKVANTNIGASGLTFQHITSGSVSNSTATGIFLDTTGALGGTNLTVGGTANLAPGQPQSASFGSYGVNTFDPRQMFFSLKVRF